MDEPGFLGIYDKHWKLKIETQDMSALFQEASPVKAGDRNFTGKNIRVDFSGGSGVLDSMELNSLEEFCSKLLATNHQKFRKNSNYESLLSADSHAKQMFHCEDRIFLETLAGNRMLKIGPKKVFVSFLENFEVMAHWYHMDKEVFRRWMDQVKFSRFTTNFQRIIDIKNTD